MVSLISLGLVIVLLTSVIASPLKFPDQQSESSQRRRSDDDQRASEQSEGRFLNINTVPSGQFNRLSASNRVQDDIEDYDENVGGGASGITPPSTTSTDTQQRTWHGNRNRPCVPYTPYFRNNGANGKDADEGRTFVKLFFNDYNYYGGQQGHRPQHGTYGGYPCYSLGGHHGPNRPHRPPRPRPPYATGGFDSTGSDGLDAVDGVSNDRPGNVNRPTGLGFFGPGGLFDVGMFFNQWSRPQGSGSGIGGGGGALGQPTTGAGGSYNEVKPVVELNVQDTVQDVVGNISGYTY